MNWTDLAGIWTWLFNFTFCADNHYSTCLLLNYYSSTFCWSGKMGSSSKIGKKRCYKISKCTFQDEIVNANANQDEAICMPSETIAKWDYISLFAIITTISDCNLCDIKYDGKVQSGVCKITNKMLSNLPRIKNCSQIFLELFSIFSFFKSY